MNEDWSIFTRDREREKQKLYIPRPCSNARGQTYENCCDGTVDYSRRQFSVCAGCIESYWYLATEDRRTFGESIERHRWFMSRGSAEKRAIDESMEECEPRKYTVAEQELRNWAAWIRSIRTPIPRASAQGTIMFRELKSAYPEEPRAKITPDIPRAEHCESLLCSGDFNVFELTCFYATYVLELTNQNAAELLNQDYAKRNRGSETKKRRYNKDNYSPFLHMALSRLEMLYSMILKENTPNA